MQGYQGGYGLSGGLTIPGHKCTFCDGNTEITVRPDGRNELDPCLYQEIETYENVTVHILQCVRCGHVMVEWERQDNTNDITEVTYE